MFAHPSFRLFLSAGLVLLTTTPQLNAQRGRIFFRPPAFAFHHPPIVPPAYRPPARPVYRSPYVYAYSRAPLGYRFYYGSPGYRFPTSYSYYRSPLGYYGYRINYSGSPAAYLYGYPYWYALARLPYGTNYSYFAGNPYRLLGYPSSYAAVRTPLGYEYRALYGSPANYPYGVPYSYSFLGSPYTWNYRYFLGNPYSNPYQFAYERTPYGYELQYLLANPSYGYGNPYVSMPSFGGGAVFFPRADGDVLPGTGQGVSAPVGDAANVPTPLGITGVRTSMGKLEWPLGLRILPGAGPLRERVDALFEAAAAQASIGSVNSQLPGEMKRAVRQLERVLARDQQERLSLSTAMYEESAAFLRRLERSAPVFLALSLPAPGQPSAPATPARQEPLPSQLPLPAREQPRK